MSPLIENSTRSAKPQAKPRDVQTRVLEPMRNTELLVYCKTHAYDYESKQYRPFSCRTYGSRNTIEYTTVLRVLMPDPTDLDGEPTIYRMSPDRYCELVEREPLQEYFDVLVASLKHYVRYKATNAELEQLNLQLESLLTQTTVTD